MERTASRIREASLVFTRLVVTLLTLLSLSGSAFAERTYVVQSGDRLSTLARRFNVSVDQLREWNRLDGDLIRVGQELVIHNDRGSRSSRSSGGWTIHRVASGDRLSQIARRYEVSVDDIVSWNRGLNPDRIRVGQEIRIRSFGRQQRRMVYVVESGDFLARIARRYRVQVSDIVGWNRGLNPDRIRIGQELIIFVEGPEDESRSVGRASSGSLVNGEQLPAHRGYVLRNEGRAWGTNETISYLLDGFNHLSRTVPNAPRLMIHDLSVRDGGPLRGHRSHQSGRDADLAYFQTRCADNLCRIGRFRPGELDVATQWALFEYWIREGAVQYMFVDYRLQERLHEYARQQGATQRQLSEWFQYPNGRRTARGIIRHEPNHAGHVHIRFSCSDDDPECR